MSRKTYLVGQFPGYSPAAVARLVVARLGDTIWAVPDGLVAGRSPESGTARPLPYDDGAGNLLGVISQASMLPAGARMQLSCEPALPTASPDRPGLRADDRNQHYNDKLAAHVARICNEARQAPLAMQFVLKVPDLRAGAIEASVGATMAGLVSALPDRVAVSVHLSCLDSASYKMSPEDARFMTSLANALRASLGERLGLVHVPVPLRHEDDAFFRPLAELELETTELCLGLVHLSDGLDGAQRRMDLATPHCPHFRVSPRSGFAARKPEIIPEFLDLVAAVAASQ